MDQIQYGLEKTDLALRGYKPGALKPGIESFYRDYYARDNCPRCRAHGLKVELFHKGGEVMAFAICGACGYVREV